MVRKVGDGVDAFNTFNDILVNLFRKIMNIEEKAIITEEFKDISNNDMQIIEVIGMNAPKNMSAIAKELSVTVGTLTIAINSLVKKGYVNRVRGEVDRRVVFISLSSKGIKAYKHHEAFHKEMVKATLEGMSDVDAQVLVKALSNLSQFFKDYKNK
ncbi:MAG: MarR family transcriptional regulator [Clostridiales bacterium]|nr:MarR family transcriptional regulator [Clostridiales bacterium]